MDIYDSRYFSINKRLLIVLGLWPYDSFNRKIVRTLWLVFYMILNAPHICSIIVNFDNIEAVMETLCVEIFLVGLWFKIFTMSLADKEMKIMFDNIARNWDAIKDEDEKIILRKYSEKGRFMTVFYLTYLLMCLLAFTFLPLVPIILDVIYPLEEKRPRLYLLRYAEFFVEDKDPYYWWFYAWDFVTSVAIVVAAVGFDTMYCACVNHCLGLFAIVRYRVRMIGKSVHEGSLNKDVHSAYRQMVQVIELHQRVLQFTEIMEDSYSICFLVLILIHLAGLPLLGVVMIIYIQAQDLINLIRATTVFLGLTVHQFYLNWPAQELIDHSGNLAVDSYYNEWYTCPPETKKLLRFLTLRCMKPSSMTAGGLMEMNMENFHSIMRTAVSYITVFASFRAQESD